MDESSTVQIDLRSGGSRQRDTEICKVIGEMSLEQNPDLDNEDEDLLSLMDKASWNVQSHESSKLSAW